MGNRISTEDLYKITQSLADRAVSDVKKRREDERKREEAIKKNREERLAAAAKQNRIPNYKGGSLWDQYKAALASGEAKNASDFITKRDARNAAWNKVGAETLNDDMEALAKSISSTYGTQFDPSKYYSQETINGSSDQVKKMRDRLNALAEYYNTYGGSDDQKKAVGEQIKAYDSELKFLNDLGAHYGQYSSPEAYETLYDNGLYTEKYQGKNYSDIQNALKSTTNDREKAWLEKNADSFMTAAEAQAEIDRIEKAMGTKNIAGQRWTTGFPKIENGKLVYNDNLYDKETGKRLQKLEAIRDSKINKETLEDYGRYLGEANEFATERALFLAKQNNILQHGNETFGVFAPDAKAPYAKNENAQNEATRLSPEKLKAVNEQSGQAFSFLDNADWATDDEKKIYDYLLYYKGGEEAKKYLRALSYELNRRAANALDQTVSDMYDKASGLGKTVLNIGSLGMNIIGNHEAAIDTVAHRIVGERVDPNSNNQTFRRIRNVIREKTGADLAKASEGTIFGKELFGENAANMLYGAAMSSLDSLLGGFTFGEGYTAVMGGGAMADEAERLYNKGASDSQIFNRSFAAGLAEYITEKVSMDNLLKAKSPANGLQVAKEILKQAGIEGSEEMASDVLNLVADSIIMADRSEMSESIQKYKDGYIDDNGTYHKGVSEKEAQKLAWQDFFTDAMADGLAGALSGGMMSAGPTIASYKYSKNRAAIQIPSIDPGNAEGLVSNARINDISVLTDVSEALKNGDAEEAGGVISEGIAWYEFLKKYGEKTYGKNQWSEVRGSIDDSISKLKKIQKLVADGSIDAVAIDEVLKTAETSMKTTPTVDMTSANDEKLFSLLAKGEPSNSVIEKNILKDRGTLAAFERLTGLRIGGTTVSQKRAAVREAFRAVSSSIETLKAAQNAIESGATATEGHKNAAVIIDQAMQANRAENSRLRNSEKVKSAETKAAIDATNRQHRFLETVRNYVINGGDLSGFTESPIANVSGEGGTNSSETKTTQETAKKRVRADFSAYQDERYSAEEASALANLNSKEEQDAFFRNENAKIEQEIKNIESSDSITAEEKAQRIGELKEALSRNYSLAKAMDDFREMGRLVRAGEVDKVIDSLRKPLKKMGVNIDVVDNIEAAEGMRSGAYFDKSTNTIKVSRDWNMIENVVKLELAADGNGFVLNPGKSVSFDRAVTQTIAHEIAHADPGLTLDFIKAVAGTRYDAFDLKGRLEHPDDRSWRSEDARKEENWRRYVDSYTEQVMLEMKGTEEQRRASAEKVVNDVYIFEDIMADMFGAAVDDMGHSGKAGENIFWAMNRNKPGIIKRILNALERFIARIRGKDAYLAVEQRQAAERLRDMLTGELKRAYGTEVKGEAAVESDEGKRYSITSDGKVSETASDDTSSIKEQLRNSLDTVNALESVASVEYSPTNKKELKDRAISEFRKIGFVVDRQNFGKIEIGEKQITNSLNYLNTEAEKAALLTVPKVLKRGEIISGHKDHKGRAYSTITIAAPVEINGVRGNVAATVRQTGASRYYTHRILLPNGSEFIFAESRKNEEPTFVGMPAANDSQRSTISSSSVNSISQADGNVNRKFSENSDVQAIEDGGTVENDSGEFVAESDGNGGTRWSLSTYESSGRETLRQYLDGQVSESGLTEADAKAVLDSMDDIYEICRKYEGEYVPFGAWSRAEVVIDEKGNPVFSVVKPNGEYAMNLDFSLVCKKRRALDAVLNRLIETGAINDFGFGQEEIVRVNEIIREHGFEIACDMCFVDAKRYRQAGVADQFVDLYNSIVKSMAKDGQEIDYFNFANDSSLSHTENGIDRLSDAELDFSEINEITKPGAKKTVEYRIAQYLKTHPSDRKLLSRGDFMSTAGFDAVKVSKPGILKLYNSKKGTGGPKAAQSDVQYLNDILSSKKFNRSAAYDVGGVRVQSFSDYVPRLVFDYVQMIGDLAAKRLPAHAYTKEPLFAKQFGLTGMKINMSLMPAKGNGKYAGLNADGSYAWARESFPAEEAFRIQADPEYGKNVGTIAVGISDEHIWKMLSDPDIRMVIPYHKSGINPAVAVKLNIGEYTNYTDQQNTRRRDGKQLTKAELKNIPDINRLMHRDGLDAVEASRRYVEWCEDNGYIPKFEKFAYMTDSNGNRVFNENYYKLLEDFTTMVDGEFHPQGDVTATFPGSDSAFGSMADLIKEGLEEDAVTANRLNDEVDGLAEEVRSALGREESGKRFSLSSADTDIYSRIFDMQREETELTNRIREIEKSDAFKKANDDLIKAINNDNIAEGMKAYQAWEKESGYADIVDRRDALRAELEEIRTKANNDAVSKAINEERTAIEKSGLSEADYFRKQAVKEFGYTPYFYDAGYIMPNGKMLNFSGEKGQHYGSRGQDHRAIGTIYADTNGTDALVRFMNDGNIRIMAETPGLDISASTEPSKEQYTTIRRFANEFSDGGYFAVDLSDENGKTVGTLEYEGNINPTRIVNDIKHFYETGEVREQSGLDRFRYSLARANDEYMKAVESGNVEEQQRLVDEAAENAGYDSPKVFHQTGERFWEFKTDNPVAGAYDSETPNGIFFKSNDHDIGVGGNYVETGRGGEIQMAAYLRMENTLHFSDRKEANAWYVKNVPGYEAAQTEMQKAVEPFDRQIDALDDEFFVNDSISEEEYDRQWNNLIEKLRETENKYRKRLREILDDYFLTGNSGYDSIELDYDGHRYIDGKRENVHTYIVFDGSQVKSADPITYDDSGNVIPLTERFDSGNRDIRYSLVKSAQSELKALQKENEKLRQDVDDLKQELQLTHGRKLSRDALISSIQKILIDGYGVKLSAKELYPHVTNLYDMFYNNTVDGKRLKRDERVDTMRIIEEMDKIVDAVIENAVGVDDTYVEMKKLLPELRNTKLVVPVDARADAAQSAGFENWAEFRKANFGRVGFANEGLPVDTYYMELSERYPELFPDGITHPGEQAAHIADVVNTIRESGINEYQLYDIEDERIRTSIKNDVMDVIGNAEKLQTFADRAAQKVEDTKLAEAMHYGADIAKLKRLNAEKVADIKAENRKRLSDMRRKYQDRVESVRERYAEARANRSEKQKQTVLRNKVLRKYTEASSMLDRPTTENHFTEAMREPIMEFLAAVDITTGKSVAKQGIYDRILRVIEAANKVAAEGGKNGLDIAETDLNVQEKQLIVDSGLLERMAAWVEANKGKKLTELSSAQLEELNGIFNQLKHLTAEIKRLYDPREGLAAKSWQAQKEIGLAQMKERKQVLGAKTEKAREKYEQIHFGALDAAGYYNTLGSDTMTAQFERFRQCQNRFSENIQMFTDRLGEIVDGAIPKDEHGKNAKEVTLKLSHGTLTATPAQLMSVYLMLNQEDSRRCLFNEAGGVIIGKFTAEKPKDGKAHIAGKRTFAQSGRLVLNEADAAKITAALTDGQRKRADAISALLNNEAARLGNEVSMAMYGYKKYTTENYFPMRTADDYRAIADNPNYEMNLLGLSFTKERTGRAGKALVAEDIYDVIGRHLTNMAQYNAFAQELDNAKKMYSLRLGDGTSLKQRIIRSYGREADAFYNKLINNLSGVQMYTNNSAEALSDKLLSNYKAAAVAGNVSVVLKQPMSIFRALPEFSLAGLKKSMALEDILNLSPKQLKANTAEMLKYSGIARLKAWGSSENMTRKSFESLYNDNSDTARQKINEFLTSGAENADMWTWAKLWRMSKAEIDAQGKYTAGSKEYFEAVDRKFSDVIGKTQVVQSALDSSMAVQNAKGFGKFLFAFQNEPLKQYSYLISTLNDARRGKPGAKKKLAKVIASSLANTAAVSAISTFMAWLRGTLDRDDDDELLDDLMKEFAGNSIDDLLSGAFAPVWQYIDTIMGAINSGVYGNTVERLDMAALTDLGGLINKYFISQNGGRPNLGTVQDIVNVASNLFGLPAKNIFRDVKSVIDRIILELPVPSAAKYNYLKAWKDVELTNKAAVTEAYYDVLRDAVDRGRYSDYVKIKRDMIYHGYTETKIKNAVMKSSLMDDLYELKKVNPGSYKAKVNSIVSSVSAVSSLEGKEFEDFIESAMKRREREDGGSKTDDEVYDEMHRKMEKEVKEQLIYIDVSKRAAYIKKMLKTYGEYGITEADILKVLRKAGKA